MPRPGLNNQAICVTLALGALVASTVSVPAQDEPPPVQTKPASPPGSRKNGAQDPPGTKTKADAKAFARASMRSAQMIRRT